MKVISISLQPDLLARFDDLAIRRGYVNRSEAFRWLVQMALDTWGV